MQKIVDQEKGGFQIASWDWDFYSEKVRKARYAFDESELRPYYELNHVIARRRFLCRGKTLRPHLQGAPRSPGLSTGRARVRSVTMRDGKPLALFLGDYYARPSKRGGAWMNCLRPAKRVVRDQTGRGESSRTFRNRRQANRPCSLMTKCALRSMSSVTPSTECFRT